METAGKTEIKAYIIADSIPDVLAQAFAKIERQKIPSLSINITTSKNLLKSPESDGFVDPEEGEVLFCCSWDFVRLLRAGLQFTNLKWVQTLTAGVADILDYFRQSKSSPHYLITRSSISSEAVSEYVIGQILATRRRFYEYHDQQKVSTWNRVQQGRPFLMGSLSVVLLGVGNIGKRTAALCNAFGMTVYGVTRSPVENGQGSPDVHYYRTAEELSSALSEGDYIVNSLPSTPHTRALLDNDILGVCKRKKPVFINVGRGDIISEESVLKALRSGWLSGAILDVHPVEPLPPDSLLWKEPGVTITPHVAMDVGEETLKKAVDVFVENYNRFIRNEILMDTVDLERGY